MQARLYAIIQCTMREYGPEVMGLHPSIVRAGYPEFFAQCAEVIGKHRVHGIIVHTPRGLVDGHQALCSKQRRAATPAVAHLRMDELRDSLAALNNICNEVILYEGPPPAWYKYLTPRAQNALIDDEFEGADRVVHNMLIDGNSDAAPGHERWTLMETLDERNPYPREKDPYAGVESMATVNAPQNGHRKSLTLAGRALSADGWTMRTGAFDPDAPSFTDDAPHPKFAPYSALTGERIVLDLHDGEPWDLFRRAAKLAAHGFSICVPHWQLRRNFADFRHGFYVETWPKENNPKQPQPEQPKDEPANPVPPTPPAPVVDEPKKDPPATVEPKAPPHKPWAKAQPTAAKTNA
jgi:hypothetical protein